MFTEPHSTKPIEDCVGWGLETTPETLDRHAARRGPRRRTSARELARRVRCPVLVIQGDEDAITGPHRGIALAEATGGELVMLEGSGHGPHVRDPVKVNLLLRDFVVPAAAAARAGCAASRGASARSTSPRRSASATPSATRRSPTSCASSTPTSRSTGSRSIRSRRCSRRAASASIRRARTWRTSRGHIESESAEHDLHCFQAIRRMDEILLANFMVFHDLVREEDYDLWIGDEAWELDYYLHENPEQKRAAYVWLTDFVGWLPMDDGGEREAFLTADYNAEMIEHIARFPRVRDRAVFVGNPDDIVPDAFGPDLPLIRDWTEEHYDFAGYVTGFDPAGFGDRERCAPSSATATTSRSASSPSAARASAAHLLRRVIDAFPEAKERVPDLRMIVVAGPRIDPRRLPQHDGLEVRAYVHDLYRHLAACDLAVVQGGLTTSMELTANRRPFLYFPLRHHFEQNFHVRHRLERYGAGRCMDFETRRPGRDRRGDRRGDRPRGRLPAGRDGRRRARGGADRRAALILRRRRRRTG